MRLEQRTERLDVVATFHLILLVRGQSEVIGTWLL
jgi:hypothetical protein